jgi:hypothetical protein
MTTDWRISSFNGALLAAYFIPAWSMVAYNIMFAPVHALYELPNISAALFVSDHLHMSGITLVRLAWLLALARIMVIGFFAIFLLMLCRPAIRRSGGCDEALSISLGVGSLISFACMLMASKVGETAAMRLHATELLLMLGTTIVLAVERPAQQKQKTSVALGFQEPKLLDNR